MKNLTEIHELFFSANKEYVEQISKYLVIGYPNNPNDRVSYKTYEEDWKFRSYKEVVFAGLAWTKKLFECNVSDVKILNIEFGKKKQWFNVQLVKTGLGVRIAGEQYFPFVNISYSYNTVNAIKFELGFYRFACSNGMLSGYKEIANLKINPSNLFEIPFWVNPCLVTFLAKRYEAQIEILKNTQLSGEEIRNFISQNVPKWELREGIVNDYIRELGSNAFSMLNILTDMASRESATSEEFDVAMVKIAPVDESSKSGPGSSERTNRQRKIGQFLEKVLEESEVEEDSLLNINDPNFIISDENINLLNQLSTIRNKKISIVKLKL